MNVDIPSSAATGAKFFATATTFGAVREPPAGTDIVFRVSWTARNPRICSTLCAAHFTQHPHPRLLAICSAYFHIDIPILWNLEPGSNLVRDFSAADKIEHKGEDIGANHHADGLQRIRSHARN